jgi:restriction system protein
LAVPSFQAFLLPVLEAIASGTQRRAELPAVVADRMQLTEDDRAELIGSGRSSRYASRTKWALGHLSQAALVKAVERGRYVVTDRGREVLAAGHSGIDPKFLLQYEEYADWIRRSRARGPKPQPDVAPPPIEGTSPDERISQAAEELRALLIDELLTQVRSITPLAFEHLVLDLLRVMGYGGNHEGSHVQLGGSGDGGVDGVIREDKLGLDEVYIQAKRYTTHDVGPEVVRAFSGSLDEKGTHKGVILTTSEFTPGALEVARNIKAKRISLIGGARLAELMLDHGLGVVETSRYTVHRVDEEFFAELKP